MNDEKRTVKQVLILAGLFILCLLLLWEANAQMAFFVRIVADHTLEWRAAAGVLFRFFLVLILAIGAGAGPFVFVYRRVFPKRKGGNAEGLRS